MTTSRIATNPRYIALASPYMQRIVFRWEYPTLLQRSNTCVVISPTYRNQQNLNRDTKILVAASHPNATKIACRCAKPTYHNKIMGVTIKPVALASFSGSGS